MSINRFLDWIRHSSGPAGDRLYWMRLVAFGLILLAILDKNRSHGPLSAVSPVSGHPPARGGPDGLLGPCGVEGTAMSVLASPRPGAWPGATWTI